MVFDKLKPTFPHGSVKNSLEGKERIPKEVIKLGKSANFHDSLITSKAKLV